MNKRGFTLVELMVTLAVSSMAMAGIYGVYQAQLKTHVTQNAVVDIQQNLRNSSFFIQNAIRMAGYDPVLSLRAEELADGKQRRGFFPSLSRACTTGILVGVCADANHAQTATNASAVAFTANFNADGLESDNKCHPDLTPSDPSDDLNCTMLEALDTELIAFRLNNRTIERWGPQSGWRPVAENIESLSFMYLDEDGAALALPAATAPAADWMTFNTELRSVRVMIEARSVDEVSVLAAKKAPMVTTAQVRVRNFGLQ